MTLSSPIRSFFSNTAALLLLAALATACAVAPMPPAPDAGAPAYQITSGDRLRVGTFGHPDFSGEFDVDPLGNIAFPLLGNVAADGRTVSELRDDLAFALDANFVVEPQVSVEVLTFRPFFILGQVNRPDTYAFRPGITVRQAVAMAGGFTRRAKTSGVTLVRASKLGPVKFAATPDTPLRPGDTIEVGRRLF